MAGVVLGLTSEALALDLGIEPPTVRRHIATAYAKILEPAGLAGCAARVTLWAAEHRTCCAAAVWAGISG